MNRRALGSIQVRLTLLLGLIALVVSSVAGYTLFLALQREVQRQEMTEVAGKLELIHHLVGMQSSSQQLDELRHTLDNILVGHENLRVWILRQDQVFYGPRAPRLVSPVSDDEVYIQTHDEWRMRGLRIGLDGPVFEGYRLIVAVNLRPSAQFLYAFATALVLICAVWIGVTGLLSAWAVRRSLAPIRRLSASAARIRPDNLALRLPEDGIDLELRDLVRAFNDMLARVQAAYQQMEGFNADVAHELRTPLATLISGTEIALSSPRPVAELRDALESNLEELQGLKALINDMLFLARADGGELAGDLRHVQVRQEIEQVVEYYEAALDEAGVALDIAGDAQAQANPRLLRRAIANLVSNAIEATPRGGRIQVRGAQAGQMIEISVINPGAPIAADALPRIFDRFYRADHARSSRSEGHGLGLAIVSAIARMHGGSAFARSGDSGSQVGFTIAHRAGITEK
ncbi:heavy metal sensor histidine kinase [Bordetella petrii]|uniref:heavy metal sensor histidine kinase n=1 Tax=Bordetella petrii TaxID=94624 RepID=UPI001E2E6248|nr:heavy metal sensor histidine kinase [Bordetella petrii]MCD0503945.1 heavy metal sensor histidine kinase [Bordetella petrii]